MLRGTLFRWSIILVAASAQLLSPEQQKAILISRVQEAISSYLVVNLLPSLQDPGRLQTRDVATPPKPDLLASLEAINATLSTLPSDQDIKENPTPVKSQVGHLASVAAAQGIGKSELKQVLDKLTSDARWQAVMNGMVDETYAQGAAPKDDKSSVAAHIIIQAAMQGLSKDASTPTSTVVSLSSASKQQLSITALWICFALLPWM
ncbi:hypothetical protein BCR37DRAFT_167047 [Protomyces lactucae-debilis]|uniref:Uncharacterized protein n=1 Tax=Protomyces lactucae-debilis TaxID=2754530 RepID=A0A1Y2EXU6_PROLT|nr:uncharacterized protein BCR37DRAFT_167047 [Protomyces lactucae-debilis]ORY76054.1 hypothetical protein BCR37DRAFT_167047 [Protomyces lactucae-debilis]